MWIRCTDTQVPYVQTLVTANELQQRSWLCIYECVCVWGGGIQISNRWSYPGWDQRLLLREERPTLGSNPGEAPPLIPSPSKSLSSSSLLILPFSPPFPNNQIYSIFSRFCCFCTSLLFYFSSLFSSWFVTFHSFDTYLSPLPSHPSLFLPPLSHI